MLQHRYPAKLVKSVMQARYALDRLISHTRNLLDAVDALAEFRQQAMLLDNPYRWYNPLTWHRNINVQVRRIGLNISRVELNALGDRYSKLLSELCRSSKLAELATLDSLRVESESSTTLEDVEGLARWIGEEGKLLLSQVERDIVKLRNMRNEYFDIIDLISDVCDVSHIQALKEQKKPAINDKQS